MNRTDSGFSKPMGRNNETAKFYGSTGGGVYGMNSTKGGTDNLFSESIVEQA